jgi:hypothetical protein
VFLPNLQEIHLELGNEVSPVFPLQSENCGNLGGYSDFPPSFSLQQFQQPNILFIVNDASNPDYNQEQSFYQFMTINLGYNVTYHDANDSYSFDQYDAIVISRFITSTGTVDSLSNATIPILTMHAGTCDEFQLGPNWSSRNLEYLQILNNSHYITEGMNLEDFLIYQDGNDRVSYIIWTAIPKEIEILDLAQRPQKNSDKTLLTLDKNKRAWDLSKAPERRAFWGPSEGPFFTNDTWERWNRTLHWILYDDVPGNTSITVDVYDLDNKSVPNSRVNITDSRNASIIWSQNTSVSGSANFINIPFGYYNITVEFEDSMNDTLVFQEIAGERTYDIEPELIFTVQIAEYIDIISPIVENIEFDKDLSGGTFYADIIDESTIINVYLNLTATNISDQAVEIPLNNFTMVPLVGYTYFNDTVLDSLTHTQVKVTYNIIAIDKANNIKVTPIRSFSLGDGQAPFIHEYNVTDFKNGTLEFFANITDDLSFVIDPVILQINGSFIDMHQNGSGYWVYRAQAYYGIVLNYTIFSALDSVGNENGTKIAPLNPLYRLISPKDEVAPIIWDVSDNFNSHEKGYVEIFAYVEDWNDQYQSGLSTSEVEINLSINGVYNTSLMVPLEEIRFYFEYTFNYNDTVYYWIKAIDLAGNIEPGFQHGPFIINDNTFPQVTFGAVEFGNGTVDFNATAIDWPNNESIIELYYTQNYFGTWTNISMNNVTDTFYQQTGEDFEYSLREVWYYIIAKDIEDNMYIPAPDQYKKIELTDKVAPDVFFTISNSSFNDGEIIITAWAKDYFGEFIDINNIFNINFTYQEETLQYIMNYTSFYFYSYTIAFDYLEEVEVEVWTSDSTGNIGEESKTIIIEDYSPPKITDYGILEFQDGTVTFWVDVREDPHGSGLPEDNSSISIEYFFNKKFETKMSWNGTGDFYSYSVSGFEPENAFVYRISAYDNSNNSYSTEFIPVLIIDNTPPIFNSFGYQETLLSHNSSVLNFWADVEDQFGSKLGVSVSIDMYNGSEVESTTAEMKYNGTTFLYSFNIIYNTNFNYTMTAFDTNEENTIIVGVMNLRTYWGPIIYKTGVEQIDKNSLLVFADIIDWGSGLEEVLLEYEFNPESGGSGGSFAIIQSDLKSMEFNGSLYVVTLTFSESGSFSWTVRVKSEIGDFEVTDSSTQPYFFSLPVEGLSFEDLLPLLTIVGVVPLIFVFLVVSIRKKRQRKFKAKKRKEMRLIQRFSDILSIRGIICRNSSGIPFYTENFVADGQDLDLTAGLTSAVSELVSEVSRRSLNKGEFDLLEREGFSILTHHNEYSTISIISEGKLSEITRSKLAQLHSILEEYFTYDELEDPFLSDHLDKIKKLIYRYLMTGILRPLKVNFEQLSKGMKHFTKKEELELRIIDKIPTIKEGHLVFHVNTYTSVMQKHGVSLVNAYSLLDKCYFLKIIRGLSEGDLS